MKHQLRNHVLATLLLLPAATLLAVLPASALAQPRRPEIRSFQASVDGLLEPGTELSFRLEATPRMQASVRIRGVEDAISLQETGSGFYTGRYTLRRGERVGPDSAVRVMVDDGRRSVSSDDELGALLSQARPPVGQPRPAPETMPYGDRQPPTVKFLDPADGQVVPAAPSIHIAATFDDAGGSGVDPASVRIVVSGRDITPQSQVDRQTVTFRGALPPGRQTVEVTGRDMAGNGFRKAWSFEIAAAAAPAPVRVQPLPVRPAPPPLVVAPLPANLAIQVVNHAPNEEIGPDPALVVGRTAPNALVTVRVQAFPPSTVNAPPRLVFSQTLQANREGIVSFTMVPGSPVPGERYEIQLAASQGGVRGPESRFTLVQRPN
jgi:hypothetical protein